MDDAPYGDFESADPDTIWSEPPLGPYPLNASVPTDGLYRGRRGGDSTTLSGLKTTGGASSGLRTAIVLPPLTGEAQSHSLRLITCE